MILVQVGHDSGLGQEDTGLGRTGYWFRQDRRILVQQDMIQVLDRILVQVGQDSYLGQETGLDGTGFMFRTGNWSRWDRILVQVGQEDIGLGRTGGYWFRQDRRILVQVGQEDNVLGWAGYWFRQDRRILVYVGLEDTGLGRTGFRFWTGCWFRQDWILVQVGLDTGLGRQDIGLDRT